MEGAHQRSMFAEGNMMQTVFKHWGQLFGFLDTYAPLRKGYADLAKVHLIKDHFIWMANAPKSCHKGQHCYDPQCHLVVPF